MRLRIIGAVALLASALLGQGPALTTVQDSLYGSAVALRVVAQQTFTTADGYTIPQGYTVVSSSTSGAINLELPPNAGSTPSGSYYAAYYTVGGATFSEIWIVPSSATPVQLAAVRALLPPSQNYSFAFSQIVPPDGCLALGGLPLFTANGATCTSASGTGTVTGFSAGNLAPLFTSSVATATTTPAMTFALTTHAANTVFAGPSSGADAAPAFRTLAAADIPALSYQAVLSTATAPAHEFATAFTAPNTFTFARPACADLSDSAASCSTDATNASYPACLRRPERCGG
jgi:hypothetical protein